jgi:flagellar FliL protein
LLYVGPEACEMSEPTQATPEAPAAAPKSKIVPLLLVINTAFGGAALFLAMRKPATTVVHAAPAAAPGHEGAAAGAAAEGHETAVGGEGHEAPPPPRREDSEGAPGPVVKLEGFVIQLRTADSERYARVAFDLEIATEGDRKPVADRLSQIRDSIITYYSDRTLDELRGSEGIERTKSALLKRFDEIVPGRRIRGLFITDFVIQ